MPPSAAALQRELVAHLRATHTLTETAVAEAFLAVPRHLFLPGLPLDQVYADEAIPTKHADGHAISSSSQPAIMAIMLEQLAVAPGQRVLEIGAGTGYNAALLGRLVGPTGQVVTLDLDDDIVRAARSHLASAGVTNVAVIQGDGGYGHPPGAPYDRLILTVGAWDLAPAWHAQLAPGGRLVLPLEIGQGSQKSLALIKPSESHTPLWFESDSVRDCGFMRLRGAFAGPEHWVELGPDPGLALVTAGPPPAGADEIYAWLSAGHRQTASGVHVTAPELFGGLGLWLGLHAPNLVTLTAPGDVSGRLGLPHLVEFSRSPRTRLSIGLIGPGGLGLFHRASNPAPSEGEASHAPFELLIQAYGPAGPALAHDLLAHLIAWHAAGRPGTPGLRVRVYPLQYAYQPAPNEILAPKRHTQLVIDWPPGLA